MIHSPRPVELVDTAIREFLASRQPILAAIGGELDSFADFSRDLLSGGKRFRAQFCFHGWNAARRGTSGVETEAVVALCAGLEIYHAAALVHDDIIDNSAIRRGMAAAHVRFAEQHRDRQYAGSFDAFGRASAILLGDLLLAWSDEVVDAALRSLPSAEASARTRNEFNLMRTEVTLGQYLDILEENAWPTVGDEEMLPRAERIILYKSAKYSVEAPLVMGALFGGAADAEVAALRRFGVPLGMAFQLRDDVLGVFGDEAKTGKPSGDDLREGKRTALVALARQQLDGLARASFDAALGDTALDRSAIAELQGVIRRTGALERTELMISRYTGEALTALGDAGLDPSTTAELEDMTTRLTARQA